MSTPTCGDQINGDITVLRCMYKGKVFERDRWMKVCPYCGRSLTKEMQ